MSGERHAINCISGGVDSVTAAYYVSKVVRPRKQLLILCDYGQRAYEYEELCTRKISSLLGAPLKVIDLRWLGEISTSLLTHKDEPIPETKPEELWDPEKARQRILRWWDPCRNSLLLLVALAHAESLYISKGERYDIYIGIRREAPIAMKDNTPRFIGEMNQLQELCTHHGGYRILAPLMAYDKDAVVKMGEGLGVTWGWTYSCYAGAGWALLGGERRPVHCGACSNDLRRALAFRDAGVKDPSLYAQRPRVEGVEYEERDRVYVQE